MWLGPRQRVNVMTGVKLPIDFRDDEFTIEIIMRHGKLLNLRTRGLLSLCFTYVSRDWFMTSEPLNVHLISNMRDPLPWRKE